MPEHSEEIAQRLREEHRFRFGFHEDGGEAPSLYTDAADLIEAQHAENERLRAVVQAEIDQHFKVQDKHGQENAGPPYCAADSFLWPCQVRRRLEAALNRKDTA